MASNPYVNRVEANGAVLIDLTGDDATAADVAQGRWFHLASGERVQGISEGGGGSVFLYGRDEPSASLGSVGDIYVQVDGAFPYGSAERRTYVLTVVSALRGSSSLDYAGASEIDLTFVDSEGAEHSIRDIPDFSYSAKNGGGTTVNPRDAFDGSQDSYWESNPTPLTLTMTATIPSGYCLSALKVVQRSRSYTTDVWKSFALAETTDGDSALLIERGDMTVADWAGAYEWTIFGNLSAAAIAAFKKADATTWERTVPVTSALTATANGTYVPPSGIDGYAPVTVDVETSSRYAQSDITHESGGEAFYSSVLSPSNGGNAPSGTTQVISSSKPVDLTDLASIKFQCWLRDLDTNTSNGMRFGVSQTVPQTWDDVTAARTVYISSTGEQTLDVSDLDGSYFMFYASQITYRNGARATAAFMFPDL